MDRQIKKKKWTTRKILTIVFVAAFVYLILHLLFFRDKQSRLYINADQITITTGAILKEGDSILKLMNANMELSYMEQETRILDAINNLQNSKINLERNKYYRQSEIIELQYQIDQAQKDFERKKELYNDKVISTVEFENAQRDNKFTLRQLLPYDKLNRLISQPNGWRQTLNCCEEILKIYM